MHCNGTYICINNRLLKFHKTIPFGKNEGNTSYVIIVIIMYSLTLNIIFKLNVFES